MRELSWKNFTSPNLFCLVCTYWFWFDFFNSYTTGQDFYFF
jgi:hypothetical protein